jgi:hypothetical protein
MLESTRVEPPKWFHTDNGFLSLARKYQTKVNVTYSDKGSWGGFVEHLSQT